MTEKTKKYLVATITGIGPGNPERLVLRTLKGRTITVQMVQGSLKKICAEEGIASPKELLKKVVAFDESNSTFGFFENTMSEFQTKDYDKPGFAWGTKDDTTQGRGATVMASQKHSAGFEQLYLDVDGIPIHVGDTVGIRGDKCFRGNRGPDGELVCRYTPDQLLHGFLKHSGHGGIWTGVVKDLSAGRVGVGGQGWVPEVLQVLHSVDPHKQSEDKGGSPERVKAEETKGKKAGASQKHQACQGEPAYEVMKKALESLRDYQWRPSRRGRNLVPVSEVENMSTLASRALKRVEAEETKGPETE